MAAAHPGNSLAQPLVYGEYGVVRQPGYRDYSLDGPEAKLAVEKGLAGGQWFLPHIERKTLRRLMKRDDWHATRDTIILFLIIFASGYGAYLCWNNERYVSFLGLFFIYCTFYCSSGDSRWHECGHGTAFKTKWKNDVLYEIASFMVFREPTVWRFSHARHHTDTDIVGLDPEIDARPLDMWNLFLAFFNVQGIQGEGAKIWRYAKGELSSQEKVFVPYSEQKVVFRKARVWLAIYACALAASVYFLSPLPAMYVFLPYSLGAWHFVLVGVFQHASMEHDVLDHRKNTRTCLVNPISAFIYWNMQYHVEHHMFPMVPYHHLPELHQVLQEGGEMPKPYNSILEVYREMIPALIKQCSDPDYFTTVDLPAQRQTEGEGSEAKRREVMADKAGWVAACTVDEVVKGEFLRFDVGPRTYCVYHAEDDDKFYATAGKCTHGAADLEDGLVLGNLIECPKHNGCFDFKTGVAKRLPARVPLATFPTRVEGDTVYVQVGGGKNIQISYEETVQESA